MKKQKLPALKLDPIPGDTISEETRQRIEDSLGADLYQPIGDIARAWAREEGINLTKAEALILYSISPMDKGVMEKLVETYRARQAWQANHDQLMRMETSHPFTPANPETIKEFKKELKN